MDKNQNFLNALYVQQLIYIIIASEWWHHIVSIEFKTWLRFCRCCRRRRHWFSCELNCTRWLFICIYMSTTYACAFQQSTLFRVYYSQTIINHQGKCALEHTYTHTRSVISYTAARTIHGKSTHKSDNQVTESITELSLCFHRAAFVQMVEFSLLYYQYLCNLHLAIPLIIITIHVHWQVLNENYLIN